MAKPRSRRQQVLPDDLDAFVSRLDSDSDRGSALIAAALLDTQLEDIFRRRLLAHQDSLLNYEGPLATFAARIKLARALDWIDADVQGDLDIIRDVRNKFAHSLDHDLAFSDAQIAGWCCSLRSINAYLTAFDQAKERLHRNFSLGLIARWRAVLEPPRSRYLTAVHFIAQHLKEAAELGRNERGLLDEVTELARNFNIRVQGTGLVASASSNAATDA